MMRTKSFAKYSMLAALGLITLLYLNACGPETPPGPPDLPEANISVNLSHTFGSSNFVLDDRYYVTENGDSIQPTTLIYHINNFVFITETGEEIVPPTQYFMVSGTKDMTPSLDMGQLENKTFKKVRFTLGVADSATNADGDLNSMFLDPMYWSMAAGYINFKLEARSPDVPVNNVLILHLGGYQGDYKINHTYEIDLGAAELRSEIGLNNLNLRMNLAELFRDPNVIDISEVNNVQMPNDQARALAENFHNMVSFLSVN